MIISNDSADVKWCYYCTWVGVNW